MERRPLRRATVIKATGSRFAVIDEGTGEVVDCRIRGRLRLSGLRTTSPVAVGDEVVYEPEAVGMGIITEILPRRNYVIRRASNLSRESHVIAANVDQAIVLATLFSPPTSYEFLDRFLVTCEAYRIPAVVALGKADTLAGHRAEADEFRQTYGKAGYGVVEFSSLTGEGMDELRELTAGRVTLVSGNSGVGKSTLIAALCPGAEVSIGEVSAAHGKGCHTTTNSTAYALPAGGKLIDTPGIKGFGLIEIGGKELYRYFPEMLKASSGCRFFNCTHCHEPGCAVVKAVEDGEISYNRYESYLKILQEDDKYRK